MSARRSFAVLGAALLAAALVPGPVRAADEGGTRSVFAPGAGIRALGLGSAFGALSDDASALLWNPGGLGDVRRREFQIAQAELDPLGFRETFGAFVYPDFRWGAAAVTFRQYAVDGIDGRDERNLPTGEFADRESELALGYGRALGQAWSVGATARVRRQDLAGRSGTGVGADLGFKVRPALAFGREAGWMEDVQLGFVVENAVRPVVRLDQEGVPDPTAVRAAFAIERPLPAGAWLLALDLEKPQGLRPRLHAGLEVRPHPLLALRTGLDESTLTAGAGLRVRGATIDYAFADLPSGASNRAGISWRFGPSTHDARDAAAAAEEERIQTRLAALERERQAERIAMLIAGAEAAHAASRDDEALEALSTLLAIDSTNAPARALRRDVIRARARTLEATSDWAGASMAWARLVAESPGDTAAEAGLARSRAASDARARRTAEVRRALAVALDAFLADDLAAARAGYAAVLAKSPGDAEAEAMLRRVDAAIARRAASLLQQAEALVQAGSLAEARERIERARRLDPRAAGLGAAAGALARAEQAQAAERARLAAAPRAPRGGSTAAAPAALTREQERRIAEMYKRGLESLERGQSDDALRLLESVRAMRPGYARVDEVLEREYLTRGMELFSSGRLDAAVRMWERALQVDPHDPRALGYLARANEQMARSREISAEVP